MALLAVAGLLRPEAWLLAGAYWLWCAGRARRTAGADPRSGCSRSPPSAPVVWALVDLWVTGDPLHSLHATSDLADELHRERGIAHVPGSFVSFLVDALRPPVALAALVGVVLVALRIPRPPAARCMSRSRCSAPASWPSSSPASRGSRSCRAT